MVLCLNPLLLGLVRHCCCFLHVFVPVMACCCLSLGASIKGSIDGCQLPQYSLFLYVRCGVKTESLATVLQIDVIISGCSLRHGKWRTRVSPIVPGSSKCRVLSMMIAILGLTPSRISKPLGAKLSIVNMDTIMNMSGCNDICLTTILWAM